MPKPKPITNEDWMQEHAQIRHYVDALEELQDEIVSLDLNGARCFANACAQVAGQIVYLEAPPNAIHVITHLVTLVVIGAAMGNNKDYLSKLHIEQLEYILGVYKDTGAPKAEFLDTLSRIWDHSSSNLERDRGDEY